MAVLTPSNKIYAGFAITKFDETDDGHLVVYGKASDGSVDSDRQIVDPSWSGRALKDWMSSGANVRVQHQSRRDPAGKGIGLEIDRDGDGGHWLKALVVEPVAKDLVKHGVLRAFSVGIANPVVERDMSGKAAGGVIKAGELFEVSLVDRPANKNCGFTLAKAAGDGADDEWDDFGDLEKALFDAKSAVLDKAESGAGPDSDDDSDGDGDTDDDGEDKDDEDEKAYQASRAAWKSVEPSLVKAAGPTEYLQARAAYQKWLAEGEASGFAEGVYGTSTGRAQFAAKRDFDRGVGGGVDRDKLPASDFAGPNRTFPIVTPGDVSDAGSLIGHADDPAAVRLRIMSIAHRKGPEFVAAIPDAWKNPDSSKAMKPKKGKKPAFDGAAEPFDGQDSDGDGKDGDKPVKKTDDAADSVEKAGGKTCKGCGKVYHMDTQVKNCTQCGRKLPKGKAVKVSAADIVAQALEGHEVTDEMVKALTESVEEALKGKKRGLPADTKPVGTHREPDGSSSVEQLEPDAGLPTDPDPIKDHIADSVKDERPVPYSVKRMHDVFCAAYHEDDVRAEYPSLKKLADAADEQYWSGLIADAAGDAQKVADLAGALQAAQHLKGADPNAVADARAMLHKSFTDMYPNTSKPTPTDMSPGRFQRPYLSAGRAPLTSTGAQPRVPPSTHTPEPEDFQRGMITAGHQAKPPAAKGDGNNPNGYNSRDYYGPAARDAAKNAMTSLHDRLTLSLPDLCPMAASKSVMPPDLSAGSVPTPATMPETRSAPGEKSADGEVVTLLKALLGRDEKRDKKISKANKKIERLTRQLDELGSQPDPAQAPVRGVVRKSAGHGDEAAPVERRSFVDEAQQHAQQEHEAYMAYLQRRAQKSNNPATRHSAEDVISSYLLTKAE